MSAMPAPDVSPFFADDAVTIWHADALALPIPDESVDLIVTSPPYFGLRSYQDGGEHYTGQIGSEPTPAEFVAALIEATREMVRVLKPGGSIWVNLGDKYSGAQAQNINGANRAGDSARMWAQTNPKNTGIPNKSLMLIPERYRIAAVDQLGLIARAVVVWSKPNGLPESVTDRVRRSHEDWVHLTKQPRYYSAVDEIREGYAPGTATRYAAGYNARAIDSERPTVNTKLGGDTYGENPLGKLPGSVWSIATQPLRVPPELGVDHFAAFPMEWPRRIIRGWSPREVCTACGEGRRPVTERAATGAISTTARGDGNAREKGHADFDHIKRSAWQEGVTHTVTGYVCACTPYTFHESPGIGLGPAWTEYHWGRWTPARTTPGVILDPFAGTGTTGLVARVEGRQAILVDLSADYCRLARWRVTDPGERARAMQVEKPPAEVDGQLGIFDEVTP